MNYDYITAVGNEFGPDNPFEPSEEAAAPCSDAFAHLGAWHVVATCVTQEGLLVHTYRQLVEVYDWDLYEREKVEFFFGDEAEE